MKMILYIFFKVISVIGDGAMTAGLALEGLNNACKDLVVILNDNEMSISPNVGALSAYLNRILTGELYKKFKRDTKAFLEAIPKFGKKAAHIAFKTEEFVKGIFLPGMLFEELGFNYVGPIDGHNIELLIETLNRIKSTSSPVLVHVITKKRKNRFIPCSLCRLFGNYSNGPDFRQHPDYRGFRAFQQEL